jgi:uncharacterized protein YxjI
MDYRQLDHFVAKRRIFSFLGESFLVETPAGELLLYSHQKAFRLKEDIRVYADRSKSQELLAIRARQMIDFAAAYDVVDSTTGTTLGVLRRRGFASLVRDRWEILDPEERLVAHLQEDSTGMALLRRVANFIPQHFHLVDASGRHLGQIDQRFNPFRHTFDVRLEPDHEQKLPVALALAAVLLLLAIEKRQS